jgi:hypothetical protein
MVPPHKSNPITKLWERLGSNVIFNHHLSSWFELVNICMVMVHGSVKDKWKLSNLVFIKNKPQNILIIHIDLVVKMYGQTFCSLESFPFYITIL